LKLIKHKNASNKICQLCDSNLKDFTALKRSLVDKQLRLYQYLPYQEPNEAICRAGLEYSVLDIVEIKQELDTEETDDEKTDPIKTETVKRKAQPKSKLKTSKTIKSLKAVETREKVKRVRKKSDEKFQCSHCGIFTSTKLTRDRHIDIVGEFIQMIFQLVCL
jgi:hypothetical protein